MYCSMMTNNQYPMKSSPILNRLKRKLDDGNESIQNNKKYLSQTMADSIGYLSLSDDIKANNSNNNNSNNHNNLMNVNGNRQQSITNQPTNIFMTPTQQQQYYQNLQQQQQDFEQLQIIQQQAQEFHQLNLNERQPMQVVPNINININNNNNNDDNIRNNSLFIQPKESIVSDTNNKTLALVPFQNLSNNNDSSLSTGNKYVHNYNNNNNLQYKFKFDTINHFKNPLNKREENKSLALILYSEPSEIISGSLRKELMEKRNKQKILQEIKRQQDEKDQPIVHMIEDTIMNTKNNGNNQSYDPMPM